MRRVEGGGVGKMEAQDAEYQEEEKSEENSSYIHLFLSLHLNITIFSALNLCENSYMFILEY